MHSAPLPTWARWQRVLNEHWPRGPAYRVPVAPEPIRVRVRIVWQHDGSEWLDASALRWTRDAVMIAFEDPRLGPSATWVAPRDVVRASDRDGDARVGPRAGPPSQPPTGSTGA